MSMGGPGGGQRVREPGADPAAISNSFPGRFLPVADLTQVKDPHSQRLQGHIQLPSHL